MNCQTGVEFFFFNKLITMKSIAKLLTAFVLLFIVSNAAGQNTGLLSRQAGGERVTNQKATGQKPVNRNGKVRKAEGNHKVLDGHTRIKSGKINRQEKVQSDRKKTRQYEMRKHRKPMRMK